ncbi:MAG: BamA/TamA family outer membrane protein, partial [Pseudomonadota bacterium]
EPSPPPVGGDLRRVLPLRGGEPRRVISRATTKLVQRRDSLRAAEPCCARGHYRRLGEPLDGREPPPEQGTLEKLPRLLLLGPRIAARACWLPAQTFSVYVEEHKLVQRTYWALTSDDRLVGLRPSLSYQTGFLPAIGARYFDRRTMGPGSLLELGLRSAGPSILSGSLVVRSGLGQLPLGFRVEYGRRNDALFGGTSGESLDELKARGLQIARYSYERAMAGLDASFSLGRGRLLVLSADADVRDYADGVARGGDPPIGEVYCAETPSKTGCASISSSLVPGFEEGLRVVRFGASVAKIARTRKRFGNSLAGKLGAFYSEGVLGDRSRYLTVLGDLQLVLGHGDRALLLRTKAGAVQPLGETPVPFEELHSPGGPEGVRGLASYRLRGNVGLVGTAEYRWLLTPFLDAAFFVDYGGAFRLGETIDTNSLTPSIGLGLRLFDARRLPHWSAPLVGGIQIAYAFDEGIQLVIRSSPF